MAQLVQRKPPTVIVINEENTHLWQVNGKVDVTLQGTFHETSDDHNSPFAATMRAGFTEMSFASLSGHKLRNKTATQLALAVLEGDSAAALLLADLVQEEYLAPLR